MVQRLASASAQISKAPECSPVPSFALCLSYNFPTSSTLSGIGRNYQNLVKVCSRCLGEVKEEVFYHTCMFHLHYIAKLLFISLILPYLDSGRTIKYLKILRSIYEQASQNFAFCVYVLYFDYIQKIILL